MKIVFLVMIFVAINGCNNHLSSILNLPVTPYYLYFQENDIEVNEYLLINFCNELFCKVTVEDYIDYIQNNKFKISMNEDFYFKSKSYFSDLSTIKSNLYHIAEINEYDYKYIGYSVLEYKIDTSYYIFLEFQSTFTNCLFKKKCTKIIKFVYKNKKYSFDEIDFYPKPENSMHEGQ